MINCEVHTSLTVQVDKIVWKQIFYFIQNNAFALICTLNGFNGRLIVTWKIELLHAITNLQKILKLKYYYESIFKLFAGILAEQYPIEVYWLDNILPALETYYIMVRKSCTIWRIVKLYHGLVKRLLMVKLISIN